MDKGRGGMKVKLCYLRESLGRERVGKNWQGHSRGSYDEVKKGYTLKENPGLYNELRDKVLCVPSSRVDLDYSWRDNGNRKGLYIKQVELGRYKSNERDKKDNMGYRWFKGV